jgi:hypothetical protein
VARPGRAAAPAGGSKSRPAGSVRAAGGQPPEIRADRRAALSGAVPVRASGRAGLTAPRLARLESVSYEIQVKNRCPCVRRIRPRSPASRLTPGKKILPVLGVRSRRHRAAAKNKRVDPQAWLADVLSRIAAHPAHRLDEFARGVDKRGIPTPRVGANDRDATFRQIKRLCQAPFCRENSTSRKSTI